VDSTSTRTRVSSEKIKTGSTPSETGKDRENTVDFRSDHDEIIITSLTSEVASYHKYRKLSLLGAALARSMTGTRMLTLRCVLYMKVSENVSMSMRRH
jgi:hypothetical protein